LDHSISKGNITPIQYNLDAIMAVTPPQTVRDIRRFYGVVNFYHQFIPHCSEILAPISKLKKTKSNMLKLHGMMNS
jgi:hypothetical protein